MLSAAAHGRSPEWAEGQRLACVGARGRPLRLGLRCLSLQFTSPSARFCVATFISGSKVLHTLAPWWSGTRRYTYWGSAVFLLFSEPRRGRGEVGPRGVFSLEKESGANFPFFFGGVEAATHTCPLVIWYSALYLLGFGCFSFIF